MSVLGFFGKLRENPHMGVELEVECFKNNRDIIAPIAKKKWNWLKTKSENRKKIVPDDNQEKSPKAAILLYGSPVSP